MLGLVGLVDVFGVGDVFETVEVVTFSVRRFLRDVVVVASVLVCFPPPFRGDSGSLLVSEWG